MWKLCPLVIGIYILTTMNTILRQAFGFYNICISSSATDYSEKWCFLLVLERMTNTYQPLTNKNTIMIKGSTTLATMNVVYEVPCWIMTQVTITFMITSGW